MKLKMNFLYWYLKPKKIELNGELYQTLGVDYFKSITPFELIGKIKNTKTVTIKRKNQTELKKYFKDTIAGEIAHLVSLFILFVVVAFCILKELFVTAVLFFLTNILVNLYPIFLMRFNRFRISKVLNKPIEELLND
ncbi:hypothetical protein [Flavobacterium sp. NRK F7]|uniref:glycosyl-4,4'-diaponeurosporenoate acyltransferase CrtO family protein n=1 Tax=Flavobacterium sp. NRK F7 TaxID=2954930 RepID=UPI002090E665|nr:hypothetical protein [Flavobacterium sp. NRK F7]MCO6164071.1 hypothetical protein [Flavobacterium sp. NRK F7]